MREDGVLFVAIFYLVAVLFRLIFVCSRGKIIRFITPILTLMFGSLFIFISQTPENKSNPATILGIVAMIAIIVFWYFKTFKGAALKEEVWEAGTYKLSSTSVVIPTSNSSFVPTDFWTVLKDGKESKVLGGVYFDANTSPRIRVRKVEDKKTGESAYLIVEPFTKIDWLDIALLCMMLLSVPLEYIAYKNGLRTDDPQYPIDVSLSSGFIAIYLFFWAGFRALKQKNSFSKIFGTLFKILFFLLLLGVLISIMNMMPYLH